VASCERAAPIAERYQELRDPRLQFRDRKDAFHAFGADVAEEGLYVTDGRAPHHVVDRDDDESAGADYDDEHQA